MSQFEDIQRILDLANGGETERAAKFARKTKCLLGYQPTVDAAVSRWFSAHPNATPALLSWYAARRAERAEAQANPAARTSVRPFSVGRYSR